MSRVRGKDTGLELKLRKALWAAGIRGWRCHVRSIVGTPDLVWKGRKVVVFVDSAWWHGHPSRWKRGKRPGFWDEKISDNKRRDASVNRALRHEGWAVVRIWDFEVERDLDECVRRVDSALADSCGRRA